MFRRVFPVLALLGASLPAQAANKDIERLQIQIAALQGQIVDIQRLLEDNNRELRRLNEALAEQGASFRRMVQERRVQEEAMAAGLKDITERMGELQERLDEVGRASAQPASPGLPSGGGGTGGAEPAPGGGPPPTGGMPPPAPRELYSQAYADYARGNFDLAIQEYREYLRNYPDTELSDNAQYWIGECFYSKQKYPEAIEAWNDLFRQFPSSDKLPDARFKKGMALERLGRRSQALIEYRYVVDRFPNSEAGRKAREKLSPQ